SRDKDPWYQDTRTFRGTLPSRNGARRASPQHVINHARRNNGRYRGRRYGNSHFDHDISRRGFYDDGDEDQFLQTSHQRTVESRGDRGKTGKTSCFRRSRAYESKKGNSGKG